MPPGAAGYPYAPPSIPVVQLPPPPPLDLGQDDLPRPIRRRPPTNPIADFLTFRLMLTPILIQIFFWLGSALSVFQGVRMIAASFDSQPALNLPISDDFRSREGKAARPKDAFSPTMCAMGIGVALFGPLFLRLVCEEAIIFFKIHEELKENNDRQRRYGRFR